jgi:hypothetical protein
LVTRGEVQALVDTGLAYEDIGVRLGIHPGLAYMIATGLPADGSLGLAPEETERPGFLDTSTQRLASPAPVHNPTHHDEVQRWIRQRVARDAQMQQAGAADSPQPPPLGETKDDADVLALLPRDHNGFHKLATRLKYVPTAAKGATDDQIAERAAIIDAIGAGLQRHEAAEEAHLWPFVRDALANGDALARDAQEQEQHGRELLARIADTTPGSEEFDKLAEQLQHALRAHVAFEDRVLLALRDTTTAADRVAVGKRMAQAERNGHGSA